MTLKTPLWTPSRESVRASSMYRFMQVVNEKFQQKLFLLQRPLSNGRWKTFPNSGRCSGISRKSSTPDPTTRWLTTKHKMPGAQWFSGAELNFAENLLRYRDDRTALIFKSEVADAKKITYAQLYDQVARLAKSLREMGVKKGDRVVGFMPNSWKPSSPCSPAPASARHGLPVPRISASREFWTASDRSNPRSSSPPTATTTTANLLIPWNG